MTERRARYWCVLADVLHLSPRDIDDLTVEEFDQACAYVDELNRQLKEPQRSG